jgi:hypothetical protein
MTDEELLALAYKALTHGSELKADRDMQKHWNPIKNDGDALSLAVSLKLLFPCNKRLMHFMTLERFSKSGDIDCANTRRAIVRAAAEAWKPQ